ncbi:MAG: hypothetical protein U1F16_18240 [Turneriella sp.]
MLRRLTFAVLLGAPLLFAQKKETTAPAPDTQPAGGRIRDERVSVENVSFWKKNATDGKGDYLEVTFDIVNKTEENIPLKMFIIAFNEKDLVDKEYRRYVEYPRWRKFDEDKKLHKVVLFNSIPEFNDAKHEEVAAYARNKEKAAAEMGKYTLPEQQPAPAGSKKKVTLQDFLRYVQYIHDKPESGLDVMLQGFENTKFTRKVEPTYRIEEKALKVNVWGKLLSKYRVDRKFFNHLGLILYDTESKKIVHRQFYSINGRFKIY